MPQKSIFRDALYIGFYVENVKFPHSLLQNKFGYDIINVSVYHKGTSKNLPHGRLPMTNIIYCVAKPCNTSSITAVRRLVTDICHIRNSARVPVFREPHNIVLNLKKGMIDL